MDEQSVMVPTPIVRITAEQLEYLISRLRRDWSIGEFKKWRAIPFNLSAPIAGSTFTILKSSATRIGVWISANTASNFLAPKGTAAATLGILLPSGNNPAIWIGRDTVGWQITQAWDNFNTLATTTVSGLEVYGADSWAN